MNPERWQRVKTIFHGAAECEPAARARFLSESCGGDGDLRSEVESLLACDSENTSVLNHPVLREAALPGQAAPVLNERYEVERELGRGGMSVVYLARDRQLLARRVVIKVLLEQTSQDAWMRQKFLQEMEALARIDHPGVVGVLDTGLTGEGKQFLVMQYIEGATLRGAMEPGGMNAARAAELIRQIGQALGAAHEKGVWHRDLKPENIMLQRLGGQEHVKLIDFGIAGIQDSKFSGEKTKVAGSLRYMAPEQFAGRPCAASDTYALGMVAYEVLTGNSAYPADSMMHLVAEDRTRPAPPRESRPDLSAAAERSILRALSFRPELRQAGAREFSDELFHALTASEPVRKTSAAPGTVEMAHVLFTDLVGYSLLPMDRQKQYLGELQGIVRESRQFQLAEEAGDIISLPTGDGMALAFFGDPTAPAQCAVELARGLKSNPHLQLRMGIHTGPVYRVADVNANANVAGGGINMAQRVMDCGDAGHILVSRSVADVLAQLSQWAPHLTDLGECTVKHGVKVHICSLATAEAGNRERPRKLAESVAPKAKSKILVGAIAALAVAAAVAAGAFWMSRSGKGPAQASIAVLPFVDMSQAKDQAYFSEGLAEELLNELVKIPGLRVAGRTSSFQFRDKTEDLRVIGKKLNVATVLEGSVRRQGNWTKITAQLINAGDGFHLWSETYDREMNDIFAVEGDIARAVSAALRVKLLGNKSPAKSTNGEAYNAYLRGRYFLARQNKENLDKAAGYFERAIQLDPGYAQAWVGLGQSRSFQEDYGKAREAVERALALDPDLGAAHAALGWIKRAYDWDWAGAEAAYRRALALEPGNADAIGGAASLARVHGRLDEALTLFRQALEIDPLNPAASLNVAFAFYTAGRYAEAEAGFKKVLEFYPDRVRTHALLGRVYLAESRPREALAEAEKESRPVLRLFGLALAHHALGRKRESDASLAELIEKFQATDPYQIAMAYAYRGETDRAFEWLERAYAQHDAGLSEMKGAPLLKSLERDPRHAALLKKMRLPL